MPARNTDGSDRHRTSRRGARHPGRPGSALGAPVRPIEVAVVGIGYAGLPLAVAAAAAGHRTRGLDLNDFLVAQVNIGSPRATPSPRPNSPPSPGSSTPPPTRPSSTSAR
ncbi:hypothetical protein ACFQVA_41480 [Actinomadura keratinilytica]